VELLRKARNKNASLNVTGMLLFIDGCFFQILEGPAEQVDQIYATISADDRHGKVTTIIREPIAQRDFNEWTMGYVGLTPDEAGEIDGLNDFFTNGQSISDLDSGRAKKLLQAFKQGRWRVRLSELRHPVPSASKAALTETSKTKSLVGSRPDYTFAYQPIIDLENKRLLAYEALMRGLQNEPASAVLQSVALDDLASFDDDSRRKAVAMAGKLGLEHDLHLNFWPETRRMFPKTLDNTLQTAQMCGIRPSQLVIGINHAASVFDAGDLARVLREHRSTGMRICIENFGHGYAGLSLLEHYHPDYISVNMDLVRDVDSNGPRQAILRGLLQTCGDLGIDIIAKGVETPDEYDWLRQEGFQIFQGNLLAKPSFEALKKALIPTN